MDDLPGWTKEGDFPLDTRLEPKGRWVTTPLNDLSIPKPAGQAPRNIVLRDAPQMSDYAKLRSRCHRLPHHRGTAG